MFPGPLGESLAGKALKEGTCGAGGGRHQAVRQGSPWHGGRRALRRRRRHGDEARRAVGGDRGGRRGAGVADAPKLLMSPRGAPFTSGARAAAGGGAGCAAGVRAVRGRRRARHRGPCAGGDFGRRFRAFGRRDRGHGGDRLLRAAAARRDGRAAVGETRRVSRTDCWSTRTTPGPRPGPGPTGPNGACRRSWSRATTARSPNGGCGSGKRSRGDGGPICGRRRRTAKETKRSDERMDAMNILDTLGQATMDKVQSRAAGAAFRAGRHAARARQGAGRQPRAPAGL